LFVSDRAHVLVSAHQALDRAREEARGEGKLGTTTRGIGPAYEGKVARVGLRVCDLLRDDWAVLLRAALEPARAELAHLGDAAEQAVADSLELCAEVRPRLAPFVRDVSCELAAVIERGGAVLFEGAQGTLLDVDHGTYPYVTSSNATAGGACTGTGVAPTAIDGALGILKAYTTRVGGGPFPTELLDETGEYLRTRGREFGVTTGRPRRCGWLDLVAARAAVRLNGVGVIALTKLDVLDPLAEIPVCVGYEIGGRTVREVPADTRALTAVRPVYEVLPGWQSTTEGVLEPAKLPVAARRYVEFIERTLGAQVGLVSTGPRREETLLLPDRPRLFEWLGERTAVVAAGIARQVGACGR
jgi:adenylosuccinate synthase